MGSRNCDVCGKNYNFTSMKYHRYCPSCYKDNLKEIIRLRHAQGKRSRLTIRDIKDLNRKAGQHWFSPDTMRFFKSRVPDDRFPLVKNKYFISSEKSPWDARRYTIREWNGKTKQIGEVGEFGAYKTKTQAERDLQKLIKGMLK